MERFRIIAFTHKTLGVEALGKLHISADHARDLLASAQKTIEAEELMYLSTCNRVEFLLSCAEALTPLRLEAFFNTLYPGHTKELNGKALIFEGEQALRHLFEVASSIDSLVVGEREIITQVRNAYEQCREYGLTGDLLRLVVQRTIQNAKEVYTQTGISRKPVSVVSLAYRRLRELNVKLDARFIIVGAGVTNTAMCRYLKKHGFSNFSVFNRTLARAQKLADELHGKAFSLEELKNYTGGFDVIVTCTGAPGSVITKDIYTHLIGSDRSKKVVIDLAVPNDLDEEVLHGYDINLIAVNNLQEIAKQNLREREQELEACRLIIEKNIIEFRSVLKERQVELAMSEVPRKVKEIREIALNEIFAKDISSLDPNSRELLDKVLAYMEKKYISVPMKMAKEILIDKTSR